MRARLFGLSLVLAALAPMAAAAQEAPAAKSQDDGIVVTGQREVTPKVAHHYVRQIMSSVDGQLIRFKDPVCPAVIGFADPYNAMIAKRIRKIAAKAGVRVAGEKCRGNLILVLTPDADALVKDMRKNNPEIFEGVNTVDLQRAFQDGPVHVWNTTEILNEDGQRATGGTLTVKSASILELPTQQAIVGSMVVIDNDAALGKTLTQIADYTAMRALAGARPPKAGIEAETILTLFDPQVVAPPRATSIDQSYLQGLYETRPTSRATTAMGRISRRIRKNSKEPAAGEN
ncbi:hypothetical protein [Sphingomonas sp. dw_22]|uniref:hypothetical protein n=1 Tax=Sphingomonas sp. dw_22 TaxID=2721175 RepID=UPI001BD5180F|nr:hypothetical protein [Sphingomonas sp. dw_22]